MRVHRSLTDILQSLKGDTKFLAAVVCSWFEVEYY